MAEEGAIRTTGIEGGARVLGGGGGEEKDKLVLEDLRHFVRVQVHGAAHICKKTH